MDNYELYHYGVKGMKWGVRRTPEQLAINSGDSAVTKRVKKDYNSMSDREFMNKYATSKKTYAKRVQKYGDPNANAPLAKLGRKLNISSTVKGSFKSQADKIMEESNKRRDARLRELDKENEQFKKDMKKINSAKDEQIKRFMDSYVPTLKKSPNSLNDLDDLRLIDEIMSETFLRKEYNVSDEQVKRYEQIGKEVLGEYFPDKKR